MTYEDYVADNKGKGYYLVDRATYNQIAYGRKKKNMGSLKRKRGGAFTSNGGARKKRRTFRKGFDRTAGLYTGGSAGELKWIDFDYADSTVAAAGVFFPTNGDIPLIAAGTGESQRIGRKVWIKKIQMRYTISLNSTSGATIGAAKDRVRVILYQDKQANGAIPAANIILQTVAVNGFRNMENIKRFNILFDKTHVMNSMTAAGDGAANDTGIVTRQGTFFKDCNIPIEYSGTAGTIGEIRSNNLGLLVVVNDAEASAFLATVRLRYLD